MIIETKVRKIGNSLGIVLPKEALNTMKVEEDAVLRTLALAAGEMGEGEFAAWLEESCKKAA